MKLSLGYLCRNQVLRNQDAVDRATAAVHRTEVIAVETENIGNEITTELGSYSSSHSVSLSHSSSTSLSLSCWFSVSHTLPNIYTTAMIRIIGAAPILVHFCPPSRMSLNNANTQFQADN